MARHVNIEDRNFVSVTLPKFARGLYDAMYAEGAPFGTTHSLIREYATRVIELTSSHHPDLFSSPELQRSKPPFRDEGLRKWGESEIPKEEYHGLDSPFHMDFENYTIGRLVPERGNYDYKHEGYRKIRTQILWRVEQLGWSSLLFKDVDNSIANERYHPRTGGDAKKTDRYGKKYSWIAFFEMSGFLHDQGMLKNLGERTTDVDIDPSFPERVSKEHLIKTDFLGDPKMDIKEWISSGPLPDVGPYLRSENVQQQEGPWIALDGFAIQQDEKRGRSSFCFIRSFLLTTRDADSFLNHLRCQDLGGRWLPEKPKLIYTFAGEIPWCETFPKNGLSDISFVVKEEPIKVLRLQQELYLNGKKLGGTKIDLIRHRLFGDAIRESGKEKKISEKDLARIEVREVPIEIEEMTREYAKFNVLVPVCDFSWEGHRTATNNAGHATILAKEIAFDLELMGKPQTFDLFTKDGVRATFNISDHSNDFNNHQHMVLIRESVLKTFLDKNDLVLIWAIWGERNYSSDQVEKLFHSPDRPEQTHGVFSFVKRYE